jgi:hypothetical protein
MSKMSLRPSFNLSWLKLVHTSAAADYGFEGLAEAVREGAAAMMTCLPA